MKAKVVDKSALERTTGPSSLPQVLTFGQALAPFSSEILNFLGRLPQVNRACNPPLLWIKPD
jgi:hypothetical protein